MAYNSSTGILTAPFTKIAVNGKGDLQLALKSTSLSQSDLFLKSTINKWAKYQPFKDTRVYTDRYTDTNSQRLAGLKAANWGWGTSGIPSYANFSALRAKLAAGVTPGDEWKRQTIAAGDTLRALDFDGYASVDNVTREWGGLGQNGRYLFFPFNGTVTLSVNGTTVNKAASVSFFMDGADPDVNSTGLLYLRDFSAMTSVSSSFYNFADWYLGLLMVKKSFTASDTSGAYICVCANTINWFVSSSASNPGLSDVPFMINGSTTFDNGAYYLYPVLCSMNIGGSNANTNFVALGTSWSVETVQPGRIALIDGYRMEITVNNSQPIFQRYISFSGTAFTITFENGTSSPITYVANMMYAYIQTEHDFDDPSLDTDLTSAKNAWYQGTAPTGDIKSGTYTYARLFNIYSAFYAANGNSNVLAAGKSVSFKIETGASYNGYPYNNMAGVDIFVRTTINGITYYEIY